LGPRLIQPNQAAAQHGHAHAHQLTWTEMTVGDRRSFEKRFKILHDYQPKSTLC
jgi:hypothetical protein